MDNKKIENVVIVNDFNYTQGGASKVAIDTARLLNENGLNVYFFSAVNKIEENIEGITYISTNQDEVLKEKNRIKGAINGIYNFKAKRELKKLLEKLNPENTIIHVHGWTKALSSSVFLLLNKMKFKIVITVHDYFLSCPNGGFFNYNENTICRFKPMSIKCLKCNCDSRNYLFKIYRVIRQIVQNRVIKKIKANAIYISDFSKNKIDNKYVKEWNNIIIANPAGFEKSDITQYINDKFIFIGRVSKEKGIELYCEAIEKTNSKGIVIGEGPLREELERKYKNIEFYGWRKKEEIKEELLKSRALVFASLWYETMGLTAIEAHSLGIPVIVGDECCTAQYIENNKNGLIYKMGDLQDLCKKIEILKDDRIVEKMKENTYKNYWLNPFSYDKYINNLLEFYKKI